MSKKNIKISKTLLGKSSYNDSDIVVNNTSKTINPMNNVTCEQKISCMLFGCPMVEEVSSCSLSNLRILTSKQKFWVDEKVERKAVRNFVSAKYLCLKHK